MPKNSSWKNKEGSALLYTVLIASFLAGLIYFFYQSVANLSHFRTEQKTDIRLRTALEGVIDYTRRAINNRWCMDMSDFSPKKSTQSLCQEWEEGFLLRLLVGKAERIETILERVKDSGGAPAGLKAESSECSEKSIRCAHIEFGPTAITSLSRDLQNILQDVIIDPNAPGRSDSRDKKIKDLKIEITRMEHTALPQYSNGTLLKIFVEATLEDGTLFNEKPHGEAIVAFYPRELNQFALIVANDLRLDGAGSPGSNDFVTAVFPKSKEDYTGKNLIFKSPVFVNGNLVLPRQASNSANQQYSPITFNDKVYLGQGVIKQVSETGELTGFAPKSLGDPLNRYASNSDRFGGLKRGIRRDMVRDQGLDVLYGPGNGSSALTNVYLECKDQIANGSDPKLTEKSDFVYKGNINGQIVLALTDNGGDGNGNEFRPLAITPEGMSRRYNGSIEDNDEIEIKAGTDIYEILPSVSTLDKEVERAPSSSNSDEGGGSSSSQDSTNNNASSNDNNSGSSQGYFFSHFLERPDANGNKSQVSLKDLGYTEFETSTSAGVVLKVDVKLGAYTKDEDGNDLTQHGLDHSGDEVGTFYLTKDSELTLYSASKGGTPNSSDEVLTIKTETVVQAGGEESHNQLLLSVDTPDASVHNDKQIILNVTPVEFGSLLPSPSGDIKFRNNEIDHDDNNLTAPVEFIGTKVSDNNGGTRLIPKNDFQFVFDTSSGVTPSVPLPSNFVRAPSPHRMPASDNNALIVDESIPSETYSNTQDCAEIPVANNFRGIASTDVSYAKDTKFVWFFKPMDPDRSFNDFINNVNPSIDNIIFDSSNARSSSNNLKFNVTSIARDCRIKSSADLVIGHLVCNRLIIENRSSPLTIIGTIIAGQANIPLTAIENGINWMSIYTREALYILRTVGVLGPTPPTQNNNPLALSSSQNNFEKCNELEMNPNIPLWHMEPDFDHVQARYWCSVNSLRNASDNFTWPRVDPDCGLSPGGAMKCKFDITHIESVELFRRVTR